MISLYRRVLGEAFDTLPPVLQRFHDMANGGSASGVLRVTRGRGWLRHGLAALLRLPPEGERVPVRLRVVVEGERERWIRDFGSLRLETVQWARKGLLIEAVGPLCMGYRLVADEEGMRMECVRAWLSFLPLPAACTPRNGAVVKAGQLGWRVSVQIQVPVFGLLATYEGEMVPE